MSEDRKLAHIEIVDWIREIPGADRIVTYGILGWEVVDQKDKYIVGDKVIYCEIDSVLPEKPEYEFLRDRKFRVRTIKLKGQVSMGLVLPISVLPQNPSYFSIGHDVTELLGITKYLSPSEREEISQTERKLANEKNKLKKFMMRYSWFRKLFLSRKQKEGFPYWCTKSDEERVQNLNYQEVMRKFGDKEVYITEKIDYQSTLYTSKMIPNTLPIIGKLLPKKYKFIVASRNFTNNDKNSLYWKIAQKYNIEQILKENPTLTIQGEQGDTNIQGNKYGIKEPMFWVFNIIDYEKNYHYNYAEMEKFCEENNLICVPQIPIYNGILKELGSTVQELVEFSKGKSVLADIQREGIVVRCIENGQKLLSFKVINPEFLLYYNL